MLENKLLDSTGWKILVALQENGRLAYADLAKMVNLTPPAVAERVRKLEEAGILVGYHAAVSPESVGAAMTVLIQVQMPPEREKLFRQQVVEMPEILECYNVTGDVSFIVRAAVSSTSHLNDLLTRLARFGQTSTQLVLGMPVVRRTLHPDWQKYSG
jgi:Lrp/AsnC family transcriptional regulator, leucine-responsive regulatory protein